MSTTTTNYGLTKPALSDAPDITALNSNWDNIDSMLRQRLHIETGTYLGTGQYGSSHKNSIEFPDYFLPSLVYILAGNGQPVIIVLQDDNVPPGYVGTLNGTTCDLSFLPKTAGVLNNLADIKQVKLNWYAASAEAQFNESGTTYSWVAIGR